MKKTLFAAAAATAALFAAAPGFAADAYTPNGFVGADYGYNHIDVSGLGGADVNSFGLAGSTDVKLGSALNLQLDADYAHSDLSGYSYDAGGGDAHLFVRTDKNAFGLVGGARSEDSVTVADAGIEGAQFFDKFTIQGDVKRTWAVSAPSLHLTTFDLAGRYYVTDDFRLDVRAAYDRPSAFGRYTNGWDLGAGGEYRLAKQPVSFYANVDYADFGDVLGLRDTSVHVGVRWNFDGSLKSRERNGATFASTGEDFGRFFATGF